MVKFFLFFIPFELTRRFLLGFFDLAFTCCSSWLMFVLLSNDSVLFGCHIIINRYLLIVKRFLFVVTIVFLSTDSIDMVYLRFENSSNLINFSFQFDHGEMYTRQWRSLRCHGNVLRDNQLYLPFCFVLLLNSAIIYRLCQRGMVELTSSITVMLTLVCIVHLCCTLPFQCWWIYYEIPIEQVIVIGWKENSLANDHIYHPKS